MSAERVHAELQWIDEHIDGRPYGIDILNPASYEALGDRKFDPERLFPQAQRDFVRNLLDEAGIPPLPAADADAIMKAMVGEFTFTPEESARMIDIALEHPIRRMLFEFKSLPQIPSINFWNQSGGGTSERDELSAEPHFRGIADKEGRFMVIMTHNTDISDAWEREAADPRFFFSFSPQGYAVGLDVFLYGMTH